MKFKRKSLIISSINYINFLFFSFQILFKNIYCDDNNAICNSCLENPDSCYIDCRYSIYTRKYVLCSGISSSSSKHYYLKQKILEPVGSCNLISACPDKVVFNTNECVPDCNGLSEVGDFCYKDEDFIEDKYELIGAKKYKCKEYTKIQLISEKNREFHICIEDPAKEDESQMPIPVNQKCDSLYYDFDDKKCVESCENKKITKKDGKILISTETVNFVYYECRNECEKGRGYHEYHDSESDDIYCLTECPYKKPFYYEETSYQNSICREECEENHFYDDNNKCSSICNKVFYLKGNSKKFFYCSTLDECPITHPYKYKNKNLCLKSCSDTTQLSIVNKKKTYTLTYNENHKICVEDCYNEDPKYFSDDESLVCTENCKDTKNIFHYNHKCYYSCNNIKEGEFKYYIKDFYGSENYPTLNGGEAETDQETSYKEFECVKTCPNGYYKYLDLDACLKYCPKSSDKPYLNMTTKECTSCSIPNDYPKRKEGEGFIKAEDIISENSDNSYNIICYKECPSDTYFKIKDNICYPLSKASEDKNCYFPENNYKNCYPSCKEISKYNNGKKYTFEYKNICYENTGFNCGNQYYYEIDEYTKCIDFENETDEERKKAMVIQECEKHNLVYLKGKQCVKECDKNNYIIMPEETIYRGIIELGKCCSDSNCDSRYPFYSEKDKILKKECS